MNAAFQNYEVDDNSPVPGFANQHRFTSGTSQDASYQVFRNYASNNHYPVVSGSRQNVEEIRNTNGESRKRYVTEVSQISHVDNGFKKIKINQFEKLKELRQQYEILKGLPLQDQFLKHSHTKKQESSQFDSRREHSESGTSSSHQSSPRRKHKHGASVQNDKNFQVILMEKKQLEFVVGNSMRKIQQYQLKQAQNVKRIHQLMLQLDNKNNDDKLETLTKTMKRNESQFNDRIQSLKRQLERSKQNNKQLEDRNGIIENQLEARNQQIKRARDENRQLEDQIRLEKDKFLNLQIDIKRLTMEKQILEREKNAEINRLKGMTEAPGAGEIRRYEEEMRSQKHKYETLLLQFERYKQNTNSQQMQSRKGQDQNKLFQALINHLREESVNQNRASMDLISSMVAKIDDKNKNKFNMENSRVLDELYSLRNEVTNLRRDKDEKSSPFINLAESVQEYQGKIKILQRQIEDGSISKQNLMKQYENIRSAYEYTKDEYEKLNNQYQKLRHSSNVNDNNVSDDVRQLRRQLDEALFMIEKAKQEGQFNVNLAKTENQANIRLLREQMARIENEKEMLRQQLNKMRAYYQGKIQQKNALLERTAQEFAVLNETKEHTLVTYKQNSERELGDLIRKIESMAQLNERYLIQSTQMSSLQRELHQLRYSVKRMKGLNDGVDHLWQVKQTEYFNINQIIGQIRSS